MKATDLAISLIPDAIERNRFVDGVPDMLELGVKMDVSAQERKLLNHGDYFECHYRRYLAGYSQTLHRVLFEVRRFVEVDPTAAGHFINSTTNRCKGELLDKEWYEVMARHKRAADKIARIAPAPTEPAPRVFHLINNNRSLLKPMFM